MSNQNEALIATVHEIRITNIGFVCSCGVTRTTVVKTEGPSLAHKHATKCESEGEAANIVDSRTTENLSKIIPTKNWVEFGGHQK